MPANKPHITPVRELVSIADQMASARAQRDKIWGTASTARRPLAPRPAAPPAPPAPAPEIPAPEPEAAPIAAVPEPSPAPEPAAPAEPEAPPPPRARGEAWVASMIADLRPIPRADPSLMAPRIRDQARKISISLPVGITPHEQRRLIITAVGRKYGIGYGMILSENRKAHVVHARQEAVAMIYLLWPLMSLPSLGRLFGNRDHTTMLHAVRRVGVTRPKVETRAEQAA